MKRLLSILPAKNKSFIINTTRIQPPIFMITHQTNKNFTTDFSFFFHDTYAHYNLYSNTRSGLYKGRVVVSKSFDNHQMQEFEDKQTYL